MNKRLPPFLAIICIFLGSIFGSYFPEAGKAIGPIGDFFISLFKMCALPLVITIVIESFYRLNQRLDRGSFILRTFKIFAISAVCCSALGIVTGLLLCPHLMHDPRLMDFLSKRMADSAHVTPQPAQSFADFIFNAIPQNIFKSLSEGQIFSCLIFFAFLGTSIARVPSAKKHQVFEAIETLKNAIFWMLRLFINFLPLAVFCMFARLFAGVGSEGASLLTKLFVLCLTPILSLIALQILTLYFFRRAKFREIWRALRRPLLIAFSTNSSMVGLPVAIENLIERKQVEDWVGETVMPLSITFNAQALILFYSFIPTVTAFVYGMEMKSGLLGMILVGAMLQAVCAAGLPGMATLGTLGMIFGPFGIPVDLMVVILITIIPFLSPFMAFSNLLGFSWSALMTERRSDFALRTQRMMPNG